MIRQVEVTTGEGTYRVLVGSGLLGTVGALVGEAMGPSWSGQGHRIFVVADAGLNESTRASVRGSLESVGAQVGEFVLSPSERVKSLATLEEILGAMARFRLERGDLVLALGGGIVGDIAGFAAASYRRGVAVVQCPTTLLAMVDASVGGKTGVNLAVGGEGETGEGDGAEGGSVRKNFVGAFHQPRLVVADIEVLGSLNDRYFRCGLAECVKHGMMAGSVGAQDDAEHADLADWLLNALERVMARNAGALSELVERNVAVKAGVVGADVREMNPAGGRALLNLGHTFAHAIEPMKGLSPDGDAAHGPLMHGEAVSLGLVAAAHCSVAMGLCDERIAREVEKTLTLAGLPVRVAHLPEAERVAAAMFHDKKVSGGKLKLVAVTGAGRAAIVDDPPMEAVLTGIDAIRG